MSWWNAKYKNAHGEYEITFGSKYKDRAKAVEKVCQAVIDKQVTSPDDVAVVVRCKDCKYSGQYCFGASREPSLACLDIEEDGFVRMATAVDPNGFCSYGERKDDESLSSV